MACNEIKPVNPKGNQSWIFIGRTEAEAPILSPPDVKSWLIRKDPEAGKDWRQERRRRGWQDKMVGWNHQLKGYEFEQALGDSEGQGSLACCSIWVAKSWTWLSDWTTTTTLYFMLKDSLFPQRLRIKQWSSLWTLLAFVKVRKRTWKKKGNLCMRNI